jgi:hypothetical protein
MDGADGLQIRRVAANILISSCGQQTTCDPPGIGLEANNPITTSN